MAEQPKVGYFRSAKSLSIRKQGRTQPYVFSLEGAPISVTDIVDIENFGKDASLIQTNANGVPYSYTEGTIKKPISRVSVKDVTDAGSAVSGGKEPAGAGPTRRVGKKAK